MVDVAALIVCPVIRGMERMYFKKVPASDREMNIALFN
jgi:hypothetical protein